MNENQITIKSLPDYINHYNSIKNIEIRNKTIKIAILASSTIKGLKEVLFVKCNEFGLSPDIFMGAYNQYPQEILNHDSQLYQHNPDIIFLFIDIQTQLGEDYFQTQLEENQLQSNLDHIKMLIHTLKKRLNSKIIIHNFEVPTSTALGILDGKQGMGPKGFTKKLNHSLEQEYSSDPQVFIFDYDSFCATYGKENTFDYNMYFLGDIKLSFRFIPPLCDRYIAYIKPLAALTKKCIVLDLDNTLWGGIIGEDGLEGIKLGPTPEGRPFFEFQKHLLALFKRGIILAVNSKNNPEDALNVFRNHPYMILKEEHFAAMQINWNDKISNMKALAEEINIGLDSLIFFDDDKLNREIIKKALPEVKVVDLSDNPALYPKTLMELNDFNVFYLSEEDTKRGQLYAEQRKRSELRQQVVDITEYLKSLDMTVIIEMANSFNIPRISQLTLKTNQFNMTTKRYQDEEIKALSSSPNHLVLSIQVLDKFGDNGITGAVIIEKSKTDWRIDTFLLSCRIIGRRVEETILAYLFGLAKKDKYLKLRGEFIPTKKNVPAKNFYKENGFQMVANKDGVEVWELPLDKEYPFPEFIKVIER